MSERMNSEHLAVRFGKGEVYEGYPTTRLVLDELPEDLTGIDLPEGPWEKQSLALPSPKESAELAEAGYEIDSLGRPIHPWFREMVTNPEIGVVVGNGGYWNWGPNFTADPVVLTNEDRPQVALVTRMDDSLAFPGGFVDDNEHGDAHHAALRELDEEVDVKLTQQGKLFYTGVVADPRATANAWPETSAYLFTTDEAYELHPNLEEVKDAQWYYVDELRPDQMFGSHAALLTMAMELHRPTKRTIEEVLSVPYEEQEVTIIDAGHMAYDHYFTKHANDHLFVKAHDPSRFTDPFREAHSRAYLQKEFALFDYLQKHGFTYLPERVSLVEDKLLAMDALHPDKGWVWRAPQDELSEKYIHDVLHALDALQDIEPPTSAPYHEKINSTYPTYWEEGWDAIDDNAEQAIISRIHTLTESWTDDQKLSAEQLVRVLPELRNVSTKINREPQLFMAHNDARQSNIAWHPKYGSCLVDWSWGDPAPQNADATMFLIDMAKSGHDVSAHLDRFNRDYALVYIGFLLAHSTWETRDGSTTVREHQVASAVTAFQLLQQYQG